MIGAVARFDAKLWRVVRFARFTKTYHLANFEEKVEIPEESLDVVSNPPQQWPFAAPTTKSNRKSPIVKILRGQQELALFTEWVPSDFMRQGPVFFSPTLKLRKGEILTAVCQNNTTLRITITPGFATVQKRGENATSAASGPKEVDPWEDFI